MAGTKRRVLLVEDDQTVRDLVGRHLEKQGYEVARASDAEEVLLQMSRDRLPFDLVLSDLHLPGLSGMELLRLLLTHSPLRPVIMITGDSDEGLARQALSFGAAGYLLKPFQLFELDALIRQAMTRLDLLEAVGTLARSGAAGTGIEGMGEAGGTEEAGSGGRRAGGALARAWLDLADSRSGAGVGHGHRVARIAGVLASSLGDRLGGAQERGALDTAARAHELGRLLGPAASTTELGARTAQLLLDLGVEARVLRVVNHLRERWDGSGGPNGLSGPDVPLASRVLAAADALDHAAVAHLDSGREPGAAIAHAAADVAETSAEHHGPDVADALTSSAGIVEAIWVLARGPADGSGSG